MVSILTAYSLAFSLKPSYNVIPLYFKKSIWTIIAMLGIIKASAAFLLLDTSHPSQRLQNIVNKVKDHFILYSPQYTTKASSLAPDPIIINHTIFRRIHNMQGKISLPTISLDTTLYVFYTSRSTGTPKGHHTPHQAFYSAPMAQLKTLSLSPFTWDFQFTSYIFNIYISNILTGLCASSYIYIPSDGEHLNDLTGCMVRLHINFTNLTPTIAQLLNRDLLPELRTMLFGGEALQEINLEM